MKVQTTCTISYKGDRVRPGTVLDMEPEVAANYGPSVVPLEPVVPAPEDETEEEKPLEEMSHDELKKTAVALGLKKSGSMADLIERITLHRQAAPKDETEDEVISE